MSFSNFDTLSQLPPSVLAAFLLLVAWSLLWKGLALWHAAGRNQPWWFVVFLVVNTLGILEILYLFVVSKLKFNSLFKLHVRNEENPAENFHL